MRILVQTRPDGFLDQLTINMKKYLTLTTVAYQSGDVVGYLLAWCSLIPIFMFIAQLTAFLLAETHRRRLQSGLLLLGQLLNEGLNLVLKRLLMISRPAGMSSLMSQSVRPNSQWKE